MTRLNYGPLTVDLHATGARMAALRFHDRDMILPTPEDFDPASDWGYVGAVMGPVTNRITSGEHLTGWSGKPDEVILHGNPDGLHAMNWELKRHGPRIARYEIVLPEGHGGFAARRWIAAEYALPRQDTLRLTLSARCNAPTLMNLASHPYWTIGPDKGIEGQRLQIKANHVLPIDDRTLPTGEVRPVKGTDYDYNIPRAIIPGEPALDHNFCLANRRRDEPEVSAHIESEDGWAMELWTTEPGLQVYDGRTTDAYGIAAYGGIALEPQLWPDAPRHAHFPDITLLPETSYRAVSEFRFKIGSGRMRTSAILPSG